MGGNFAPATIAASSGQAALSLFLQRWHLAAPRSLL
jgi:hypothetical protein